LHKKEKQSNVLDIQQGNFRMTDAEALQVVKKVCGLDGR